MAWNPLGWRAAWLAEIEPFPCAVLAHHYPDVPNLGDMTQIARMVRDGYVPAPDVFCGGTPCQAFSIAGLRNSLDDARGNLSLTFCEIADEIDTRRKAAGLLPAVIFWENVPGVLSTKDNAFGCFLAGLAGEDDPLEPPGGKWANAGCVFGPQRTVAWRVLDAQYFGVAQRRRRVFVVASAREGFDPTEVLFEFDGVRRDTPPSRQSWQDVTAGTLRSTDGGSDVDHARAGHLQPIGHSDVGGRGPAGVVYTLDASYGRLQGCSGQDANHGHSHLVPIAFDSRQDCVSSSEVFGALGSSSPQAQAVSYSIQAGALRTNPNSGPDGVGVQSDIAYTLEARSEVQAVCFSSKDHGADATVELAPTMRAMNHSGSHANGGGQLAVCIHADAVGRTGEAKTPSADAEGRVRLRNPGMGLIEDGTTYNLMASGQPHAVCVTGDVTHCLKAEGFDASEDGTGRGQPIVAALALRGREGGAAAEMGDDCGFTLRASTGGGDKPHALVGMAVRRLTPVECARLQGFPDNYLSQVIVRGKPAADGPMYKALGNSWAVPNVRWIGARIDRILRATTGSIPNQTTEKATV